MKHLPAYSRLANIGPCKISPQVFHTSLRPQLAMRQDCPGTSCSLSCEIFFVLLDVAWESKCASTTKMSVACALPGPTLHSLVFGCASERRSQLSCRHSGPWLHCSVRCCGSLLSRHATRKTCLTISLSGGATASAPSTPRTATGTNEGCSPVLVVHLASVWSPHTQWSLFFIMHPHRYWWPSSSFSFSATLTSEEREKRVDRHAYDKTLAELGWRQAELGRRHPRHVVVANYEQERKAVHRWFANPRLYVLHVGGVSLKAFK